MLKWFPALLCAGVLLAHSLVAQTPLDEQRATVAWALTYGTIPSSEMVQQVADGGSVSEITAELRQQLDRDPAAVQAAANRAWADTFGPGQPFDASRLSGTSGYAETVSTLLDELKTDRAAHLRLIDDAYTAVLARRPYDIEHTYWRDRAPIPFILMTACIDDWARRNQPGLMATTGPACIPLNSRWLKTLALSPTVAEEGRAVLRGETTVNALATARGENVIAPGAAGIISVGRIPFLAISRD